MSGVPVSKLIEFPLEHATEYEIYPRNFDYSTLRQQIEKDINMRYPPMEIDLNEEDLEAITGVHGIEIRTMYEDADEHEGYYDTIDDAIDALNDMRKLFPHLCRKES